MNGAAGDGARLGEVAPPAAGDAGTATAYANAVYAGELLDELARAGVRHVCICPGSRSTPLALAAARHPALKVWVHLDERSAAFFALGMAKAGGEPVALIATSGTAPANFYPAVIEARYARVPLVLLTADRPHELREFGAPQTVDQVHLYGRHVKWFADLALPEADPGMLRYVRQVAARAVAVALAPPAGPVHLNVPMREPLVPPAGFMPAREPAGATGAGAGGYANDDAAGRGRDGESGAATVAGPQAAGYAGIRAETAAAVLSPEQVAGLAATLAAARRGIIVCGPHAGPGLAEPVTRLAALLGFPVLADPLSGVRCGPHDRSVVIDAYDAFLRVPALAEALEPDLVLRIGAVPTSKPLLLYLERHARARQILLDEGGWNDPGHVATEVVAADPRLALAALADHLATAGARASGRKTGGPDAAATAGGDVGDVTDTAGLAGGGVTGLAGSGWLDLWRRLNATTRRAVAAAIGSVEEPAEGRVFSELAGLLPDGATLYAGNSMPVRDLDTFFPALPKRIRFLANRGANGIDGVVSSALGAAAAGEGPLVLVIGDLSFYHDLNGLLAAARYGIDATIILINNDGGGIFSFLPQARLPEHFELLFGTPHGLDFRHAAALYGAAYERPAGWEDFRDAVRRALASPGLSIVEVRTDRRRNVEQHRQVWRAVEEALAAEGLVGSGAGHGPGTGQRAVREAARGTDGGFVSRPGAESGPGAQDAAMRGGEAR
ncbi:MAG TPA: 2-succinyl-5-enolpyruvyl-6-hydroxy-3-cyclohexene-1-carboxylic-acid synthase [Thermaerobacter sp.]